MFRKLQFAKLSNGLPSATAIAIAIISLTTQVQPTRSNSIPDRTLQSSATAPIIIAKETDKIRRYGKGEVVLDGESETVSGASELALTDHLIKTGTKFYGAYWCSHCAKQKSMFGAEAAAKLPYVECAKDGINSQRQLCRDKQVRMFPTWIINGKLVPGTRELKDIATLTGYQGPMNFKYTK
jgi:glutaredoxin